MNYFKYFGKSIYVPIYTVASDLMCTTFLIGECEKKKLLVYNGHHSILTSDNQDI